VAVGISTAGLHNVNAVPLVCECEGKAMELKEAMCHQKMSGPS
jgi:hypothetical protein